MVLLLIYSQSPLAATKAWLDRYHIEEGEILRLTIETEGDVPGDPNTDPLLPDFEIEGVANGHRQIRGANGFINYSTWTISLKPRHAGVVPLPPLLVAGQATSPLSVEVRPTRAARTDQGEIVMRNTVSDANPWVQSMVIYTVTILYNTPIAEGALSMPDIPNVLVQRLKGDHISMIDRNGRRYKRIERRYALFPQASGHLSIPTPVLNAKVPASNLDGRSDLSRSNSNPLQNGSGDFDTFVTATRPVRVRGQTISLEVNHPASQFTGRHWLPALAIELAETRDKQHTTLRAGDPVTRTITLRARGLMAEQIPPLTDRGNSNDGIYFDKPVRHNDIDDDGVVGMLMQRVVYVPRKAGILDLPEVIVKWWDVSSNSEKLAKLPAHRYTVTTTTEDKAAEMPAAAPLIPASVDKTTSSPSTIGQRFFHQLSEAKPWQWLSATLASLWLLTLLLWMRERRQGHRDKSQRSGAASTRNKQQVNSLARKRFQQACRENLAGPARHYLLEWCQSHWPDHPPIGLEDLAQRIGNDKVALLLRQLDEAVYAGKRHKWQGRRLGAKLKALPRPHPPRVDSETLPPLYPDC